MKKENMLKEKCFKILFTAVILIAVFFVFPSLYAIAQETDPVAVMPISIGEEEQLLKDAKNFYDNRDYKTAINRLETITFIKKSVSEEVKTFLVECLAKQIEAEMALKNYKEASSLNMKILTLKNSFDFVWLNKLLNIYMLSGNYRKTHELCMEILGKQAILALPADNLAKIYGKLAVVYASFHDSTKCFESLIEAAVKDPNMKSIKSYADMIFPKFLEYKMLLDYASLQNTLKKFKDAYIAAYIHSKISPDFSSSEKLMVEILKAEPALKDIFKDTSEVRHAAAQVSASEPGQGDSAWVTPIEPTTSTVVLSNVPSQLKDDNKNLRQPSKTSPEAAREFDKAVARGEELFLSGKYEDAVVEYEKALKFASDKTKEEINRKIFAAYWRSREEYIKIAAYSFILILLAALFYYFNPLSFFNREQYGLINVSQTIRNGAGFIEEKKYQKAVAELEKLIEMKLSSTETVVLFLNIGIAYYHLNSYASALMAFRKVLQYDYENVESYRYLGRIYIKTKERSHKAVEVFNFLIDHKIFDMEMLKAVSVYNASQNLIDDRSIQIAMEIIGTEPNNEIAGRTLVKYFNKVKRIDDEALKFVEKFVESYPRDIDTHVVMLEMLYRRKEFQKIISE
ncbi:MAG TPA: hypothetical protein PKK26_17445, partial [Candidatus Wallbacteria bacterium]|nr:hypothetical protein [Candidatus Wallbacteria bacterium]